MLSWSRQFLTNITTSLATITIACFQLYILRFYGDTNMAVEELETRFGRSLGVFGIWPWLLFSGGFGAQAWPACLPACPGAQDCPGLPRLAQA